MQDASSQPGLQRQLSARTLSMITLGGSLGTGIFLASGNALSLAGPGGTLLAYVIMGIMVYYLMSGLGELAAYMPSSGSFYVYASRFIDPSLGYALAWNYWFSWPITIASEIAASALLMNFWFPGSPPLLWCATFLFLVMGFNVISTKAFGLAEYWFSFIKITVIILFIVVGFAMIAGLTEYQPAGFKYWSIGDAPFHGGWLGVLSAFVAAGFSFQGTELLGIAAGESDNPGVNVPRAVRLVFWRILLFFVLSILIISLLIPYTAKQLTVSDVLMSPFTFVFQQRGFTSAALLMNGVVLIAILSTANSGLYVSSRLLWFLASEGHVPRAFAKVNRRGVPLRALALTSSIALLAFLSSLYGSGRVYFWLLNAGSLSGFITWMGIAASHYRFRKAYLHQGRDPKKLPYLAKGYPYGPLFAFGLCLLIIGSQNYRAFTGQAIDWQGVIISYLGVPLFLGVWLSHKWLNQTRRVTLAACRFD
ncbi:amino acid permease [Legionella taurinensis]|uniref:Amino acid permease n=2 Tax=Legionella taurinensis TaxID=70611 RepID=A0A3A5LF13_9GAMM|nr:amino acid permease [Legionella taurinensis]PUT39149.1 gamma-aminobutyrate permease [Legionella taurinensis]PUT39774.1 gamma-aminobutyrate permease [Legionella taurinensis]PUT43605.1 gamma-aminobutyrate permease [Legionella taurinensis]PUT45261.1 gamma-aminobutyrate permease [Legionella taurinensis]RJT46945.1 amino acid permease [Legionella taurinensis]